MFFNLREITETKRQMLKECMEPSARERRIN